MSGATFMQHSIYLSFSAHPFSTIYHLDLFSLLLSNISLFFLLTLPPTKESCLRMSYLRPLDCHPPFQFLTNPTFSTHVLSTHSSLLSFCSLVEKQNRLLRLTISSSSCDRVGSMHTEGWLML